MEHGKVGAERAEAVLMRETIERYFLRASMRVKTLLLVKSVCVRFYYEIFILVNWTQVYAFVVFYYRLVNIYRFVYGSMEEESRVR